MLVKENLGKRSWKDLNRESGEKILGRKRGDLRGGKGLREGGKDLREEKGEI